MNNGLSPKGYPQTDKDEAETISILKYNLDLQRVKTEDLRQLDKKPNTDGLLTVVDQAGIPIGNLEVQVKCLLQLIFAEK